MRFLSKDKNPQSNLFCFILYSTNHDILCVCFFPFIFNNGFYLLEKYNEYLISCDQQSIKYNIKNGVLTVETCILNSDTNALTKTHTKENLSNLRELIGVLTPKKLDYERLLE